MRGYKNFDGNPHPGDLRHRVEIGYTQNVVNENGYPEAKDIVVCRVWASATDAGNQHYRSADTMNTEAVINFTIRYRSDIKPGMCSPLKIRICYKNFAWVAEFLFYMDSVVQ